MLAIVIPYYKLDYFEATLQSLAEQTNKQFKVYIGDDASPQDPVALLNTFVDRINFVYKKFDVNMGQASLVQQWDRCIDMIGDEQWIMILGDDDFLGTDVVEQWYLKYKDFSGISEVVRFASRLVSVKQHTMSEVFEHPVFEDATDSYLRKFYHSSRSSLSEHIFSRSSYMKYGFYNYPLAWNSDDRAWLDFSDSKPIYSINESIVYIGLSDSNISGKSDNIDKKNVSQIAFFRYLISHKLSFYKKNDLYKIARRYENEISAQRSLKASEWLLLFFTYIKYFEHTEFVKFVKRFLRSSIRRDGKK